MTRIKMMGLMLVALIAATAMSATAALAATPEVLTTAKGLVLEGSVTGATTLETAVSKLEGKGAKLKLTLVTNTTGTFTATFTNVVEGKNKCKTGTEPEGTVVSTGNYKLVFTNVEAGKLAVGIAFEPAELLIECGEKGKVKIHINGVAVGAITGALNTKGKSTTGTLLGKAGKQSITSYRTESGGTLVEKKFLLANFGLGLEQADENVSEAITLTGASEFEIMG